MTTALVDALVSYAGMTAEQSAGRTVGRPSIGRGDGERVVTTARADALVLYARKTAEQLQAVSRKCRRDTANADGQQCATSVASCCVDFHLL